MNKIIMGIGDWGLGIGDWGLGPIPNPQYPIPKPQSPKINKKTHILNFGDILNIFFFFLILDVLNIFQNIFDFNMK